MRAPYVQHRGERYERKCQRAYCTYVQYASTYFSAERERTERRDAAGGRMPGAPLPGRPLQETAAKAVRAVLALQPPASASTGCGRRHVLAPRGLGNALQRTLRLASPICPPGGLAVWHRLRGAAPVPRPVSAAADTPSPLGCPAPGWTARPHPESRGSNPRHPRCGAFRCAARKVGRCARAPALRASAACAQRRRSRPPPGAPRRQKTPARPGGITV